jgi:hypothetical protein
MARAKKTKFDLTQSVKQSTQESACRSTLPIKARSAKPHG